jgi:hypothetical protein
LRLTADRNTLLLGKGGWLRLERAPDTAHSFFVRFESSLARGDVTIQAQILDLMRELKSEIGAAIILITASRRPLLPLRAAINSGQTRQTQGRDVSMRKQQGQPPPTEN